MRTIAFISVLFFLTCITSCLGPKKMNKWVANHYGENVSSPPKMKADYLSVNSPLITNSIPSNSTKAVKNFLPLILYWQYDYVNMVSLNPGIPVNTFISTLQSYANVKGLKQKLNGRKLELTIEKVPHDFTFHDKEYTVVALVYAISWNKLYFEPQGKDLVVSYKITDNGSAIKSGSITIESFDKERGVRYFQRIKKAMDLYLDQYDENMKAMTKKLIDKLMEEI